MCAWLEGGEAGLAGDFGEECTWDKSGDGRDVGASSQLGIVMGALAHHNICHNGRIWGSLKAMGTLSAKCSEGVRQPWEGVPAQRLPDARITSQMSPLLFQCPPDAISSDAVPLSHRQKRHAEQSSARKSVSVAS